MTALNSQKEKQIRQDLIDQIKSIQLDISKLQKQIDSLYDVKKRNQVKFEELVEKIKLEEDKFKLYQQQRRSVMDKKNFITNNLKENFAEIQRISKEFPVNYNPKIPTKDYIEANRKKINAKLVELQADLLQIKNLSEEKLIISSISKYQKLENLLNTYVVKKKTQDSDNELRKSLQIEIDDLNKLMDNVSGVRKVLNSHIQDCKKKIDESVKSIKKLSQERTSLYNKKKEKQDELDARWKLWNDYIAELDEKKSSAEDKKPPYDYAITACNQLISSLSSIANSLKKKDLKNTQTSEQDSNNNDNNDDNNDNNDDNDDNDDNADSERENTSITLDLNTYMKFEQISLAAPKDRNNLMNLLLL